MPSIGTCPAQNRPQFADFNLCQCYFGEHLLRLYPHKPYAIVESEKQPSLQASFSPITTGSTGGLNGPISKSRALRGRTVVLYPDAGCYALWKQDAGKQNFINFPSPFQLVETTATPAQIKEGYDIADFYHSIDSIASSPDVSITPQV